MAEAGLAAQLSAPKKLPASFQCNLTSGIGPRLQLQSSPDLFTWTSFGEIKMTTTQTNFTDATATSPIKYYRTQWIGDPD